MEKKQYSKLISSIPEPDISISMGCDVGCPFIGRAFDDNWKLEDPTGKTDDDFRGVIQQIEKNILELKKNDCNINSSLSSPLRNLFSKGFLINGFTQCHACVVQTTTRYAGVHKKLYKKITNRITIRMFKSIVKKKGDFNGK